MMPFSRSISALPILVLAILVSAGLWGPPAAQAQHPTAVTSIVNSAQDTTLEVNYSGGLFMPGKLDNPFGYTAPDDSIPATGEGTRMMWYPEKAAFRAGRVFGARWDADSIGDYSVAFGLDTKSSGKYAAAMGRYATASGDEATAMGFRTTAATGESLSIGQCNSANSGSFGDGTLFVAGNGTGFECSTRSDALVLDQSGNLAIDGVFTDDLGTFAGHFEVSKSGSNKFHHAVLVKNAGGQGADALAIQTGADDQPDDLNNFISFYDGNGTPIGAIEGDGSGGITTRSGSADFAEELPVMKGEDAPEPASLVGVTGGRVTLETKGTERVMITSTAPIMTGNATTETATDDDRRVAVAFVGQVPAKVRGPAEVGDLIVPSGKNDGTALAVAPAEYRRSTHGPIAGQAWSSKTSEGVGEITAAVGLGHSGAVAERLSKQRQRIDRFEERLTALENRSSSVPGAGGHARGAGLPGSWLWGGVLLLLLLGGSLARILQRTGQ